MGKITLRFRGSCTQRRIKTTHPRVGCRIGSPPRYVKHLKTSASCSARSAFQLKEEGYSRKMLSCRHLQDFVRGRFNGRNNRLTSKAEEKLKGRRLRPPRRLLLSIEEYSNLRVERFG